MTHFRGWGRGGCVATLVLLLTCRPLVAQPPVGIGNWSAGAGGGFAWSQEKSRNETDESWGFHENMSVKNRNTYLVHPHVVLIDFGGGVGFTQRRIAGDNGNLDHWLYSVNTDIYPDAPATASFGASRTDTSDDRPLGGRSDTVQESLMGRLWLSDSLFAKQDVLYLHSEITAENRRVDETTSIAGTETDTDSSVTRVTWDTWKGFETSDLDLDYEFADYGGSVGNNMQNHSANARYDLDFGPGLNRNTVTTLSYFTDPTGKEYSSANARELLTIDHRDNLSTQYAYQLTRNTYDRDDSLTNAGSFAIRHQLYRNFFSSLSGTGTFDDYPEGDRATGGGKLAFGYTRRIGWGGSFSVNTGGLGGYEDNNMATGPSIYVYGEMHVAPEIIDGDNGFTLEKPFVDQTTIEVFDRRGGGRVLTALGVDYDLVQEGDFIRVVPLPGGAIVLPGDPMEVNYSYGGPSGLEFYTAGWDVRSGVDFGWVRASHEHVELTQTQLSGDPSQEQDYLEDSTSDIVRLDFKGDWRGFQGYAANSFRDFNGNREKSRDWNFSQHISSPTYRTARATLSTTESLRDSSYPSDRESESYSVRGGMNCSPARSLRVTSFVQYSRFEEEGDSPNDIVGVGSAAFWSIGRTSVSASFGWRTRENYDGVSFTLSVRREFF